MIQLVILQSPDRHFAQAVRSVVGRVTENIEGENKIICCHRFAVRKRQIVPQGDVIKHTAIRLFRHAQISRAIVGVVNIVIGSGFTLNAVQDRFAGAVTGQQPKLGQFCGGLIPDGFCEEWRKFAVKCPVTDADMDD